MKYPACKLAIPKWKAHFQNSTTKPSINYSIARPTLGKICWVSVLYARVRAYRIRMSIARCLMTHRTTVRERAPDPANPLGRLEAPLLRRSTANRRLLASWCRTLRARHHGAADGIRFGLGAKRLTTTRIKPTPGGKACGFPALRGLSAAPSAISGRRISISLMLAWRYNIFRGD